MTVRIGWGFSRPKQRKPHEIGGLSLVKWTKTKDTHVRQVCVATANYIRTDFERLRDRGHTLDATIIGIARIAPDVPADLVAATVERMRVIGTLWGSVEVKRTLTS